jgi:hypothetical protein
VQAKRTFDLEFQWLQDGETILIPGKKSIGFINKDEDTGEWSITYEDMISHDHEITSL